MVTEPAAPVAEPASGVAAAPKEDAAPTGDKAAKADKTAETKKGADKPKDGASAPADTKPKETGKGLPKAQNRHHCGKTGADNLTVALTSVAVTMYALF